MMTLVESAPVVQSDGLKTLRNYIDGQWVEAESRGYLEVETPSSGQVLAKIPLSTDSDVDRAVLAARLAFPSWSQTPVSNRVQPLFKLVECLRRDEVQIARVLTEEMGKSLSDARAELKRSVENVEVACAMPTLMQDDSVLDCGSGIDGEVMRMPVGVFCAITPFNFPSMAPFWFLPYAVVYGNTFVLKCSERVPITMQLYFEMFQECGFPPGVVNLVNGDQTASQALIRHPDVDGISFVGSTHVAKIVAETCAREGKRCQALGSAKNYLVVMSDAKLDQVVRNILTSCLGCAGQRCIAASAIACVGDEVYEEVVRRFTQQVKQTLVANPLDPEHADEELAVGPAISSAANQRIENLIQQGINEAARIVLDGRQKQVKDNKVGYYVGSTALTEVKPGITVEKTELFGPVVIFMKFASLDDAISAVNEHEFGNGASIYMQNGYGARKFKTEVRAGMIGVNVGIPAPMAYMPFGGKKDHIRADLKTQSKESVSFFTEKKIVTERYWPE